MRAVTIGISFSAAIFACAPIEMAPGPGDGGDAPVWSAGGGADGGSGGPADAGSGGGAGGGSGSDGGAGGGPAQPDDCAGVIPASAPQAVSVIVPHRGGDFCWYSTTDLSGNFAAEAHAPGDEANSRWQIWSSSGAVLGSVAGVGVQFFGQDSGFETIIRDSTGLYHALFTPSGSQQNRTLLGRADCAGTPYLSLAGGTLVLGACDAGLNATRFDSQGRLLRNREVEKRLANVIGLVDAKGRTLLVTWPASALGLGGDFAARWFDGNLDPLTTWFQLPGSLSQGSPWVRPFIEGGAALQIGGAWVAVLPGGEARWADAPAWLTSRHHYDFQIVRGGKAYALIPKYGSEGRRDTLELFSPSGNRCGAGTFSANALGLGIEGTVLGAGGPDGCTQKWWPAALR